MSATTTYTSNLSTPLMDWLDAYAKKQKVTKRTVIEAALERFKTEAKRHEMATGFKRANQDVEMMEMVEEGFDDLIDQFNSMRI